MSKFVLITLLSLCWSSSFSLFASDSYQSFRLSRHIKGERFSFYYKGQLKQTIIIQQSASSYFSGPYCKFLRLCTSTLIRLGDGTEILVYGNLEVYSGLPLFAMRRGVSGGEDSGHTKLDKPILY